LSTEQFTFFQS